MRSKTWIEMMMQKAIRLLAIGGVAALTMPATAQLVEVKQKVLGMD